MDTLNTANEITIVIPTYNRDAWLKDAVESVEKQTVLPFELVICDNGSSGFAKNYQPPSGLFRYRYCKNRENIGMFGNWNRAVSEAKTRLFTILCDDDWLENSWIEQMYEFWQQQPKPVSVVSQYSVADHNKKLLKVVHHRYQRGDKLGPKEMFFKIPYVHCILFDRESLPLNWAFYENRWGGYSDLIAFIQIAQHQPLVAIDKSLAIVRRSALQGSNVVDFNIKSTLTCLATIQQDEEKLLGDDTYWISKELHKRAIKAIARDFAYGNHSLAKSSLRELKRLDIYNPDDLLKVTHWWIIFFTSRVAKYLGLRQR